jgi:hypothetical protein
MCAALSSNAAKAASMSPVHAERVNMEASLLDDINPVEVGFVSLRFQLNEGSANGYVQIRLWCTLDTRKSAAVTYRLEETAAAPAVLGRLAAPLGNRTMVWSGVVSSGEVFGPSSSGGLDGGVSHHF